jgi:acetyl esterase/lipase
VGEPKKLEFGTSYTSVHYCTDGTIPLKMTVVLPTQPLRRPTPVLIHLKFMQDFIRPFVERGFIVVNIDWREPPQYKLPAGVQDVKCGIRYLRAHADLYGLDPDHIGVFGCSRGGHTAALVGVAGPEADMEGDFGFAEQSSRVQAVVMFDGIADFRTNYADALSELQEVHGIASMDDPLVRTLSPVTYASKDDPPFLLIASDNEHWRGQARMLTDALTGQGVSAAYLEAMNAGHCEFAATGPHTLEKMITMVGDFFEENLKE